MRTMRGLAAAAVLALPAAVVLTGCSSGDTSEATDGQGMEMPASTPATFQDTATWGAPVDAGGSVELVPGGVLGFAQGQDEDQHSPVLYDDRTGAVLWQGRAVKATEDPEASWMEEDGRSWVVLTTQEHAEKTSKVYVWDAGTSADEAPTTSSATFTGKDGSPEITVSDAGVLVEGSTEAKALQYHPSSGTFTKFADLPERDGDSGDPEAVYSDGVLVSFPEDGGFSFATESGGWQSADVAPDGAAVDSGRILSTGEGMIVSQWKAEGEGDDPVLAVHSILDGRLLSQMTASGDVVKELDAIGDAAPHIVTDHRYLAYGPALFNLDDGTGGVEDLRGGEVSAVMDSVLYVQDMDEPLEGQSGDGFVGTGLLDLTTGSAMTGAGDLSPLGETKLGQGLFRSPDGVMVYSVAST